MNQIIPMRNEVSTCLLYRPDSDSRITVPNQPKIITMSSAMPTNMIGLPAPTSLSQRPAPPTVPSRPNEPTIGQWLPWGT
jgi:hypothetical protein